MSYWALRLYSRIQKFIAVFAFVGGVLGFLVSLTALDALASQLLGRGILIQGGWFGMALASLCAFAGAAVAALSIYAVAQLLDLLISMEENLRGLRHDLRQRRQRPGDQELPQPPANYVAPDQRYIRALRRDQNDPS